MGDGAEGVEGEGDELAKLSVAELWSMLSHGAEQAFDPTADARPPPSAAEYDALLDAAKPANVQEEAAAGEAAADEAAVGEAGGSVAPIAVAAMRVCVGGRFLCKLCGGSKPWASSKCVAFGGDFPPSAPASASASASTSPAVSTFAMLLSYVCPRTGCRFGSLAHLAKDPAARQAFLERTGMKRLSETNYCRCGDCCHFLNQVADRIEASCLNSNVMAKLPRARQVELLAVYEDAKELRLEDGRSPVTPVDPNPRV